MKRLLLKFPTRSRPEKAIETLKKYAAFASNPSQIGVAISCDLDDTTMQISLDKFLIPFGWSKVFYGNSSTKIEACNANMNEVDYPWDVVALISDDMIPQVMGYDNILRECKSDGILWLNDGYQGNALNTLTIMGRQMYESFGYLYHPDYKSFYCDTEFTDLCTGELKDKCVYDARCIIRHEHPNIGYSQNNDDLYIKNSKYWYADMKTYIRRKKYPLDLSILIPTLVERKDQFNDLVKKLVHPDLKIEVLSLSDNREMSVGMKRHKLLQSAKGKYSVFIDDDDDITPEYFEDAAACIAGGHDVMRLRGKIGQYTFTHSVANTLSSPAARDNEFLRPPNHLNIMLADLAKLIPFQDRKIGEDLDWTMRLAQRGWLQTEYISDSSRIHYIYNIRGTIGSSSIEYQKTATYAEMLQHLTHPPPKKKVSGLRLGPKGFVSV